MQAENLSISINDKMGLSKVYVNLSELYSMQFDYYPNKQKYADSIVFFDEQAFKLATEVNSTYLQNKISYLLKNIYQINGNLEKAIEYADILIATNDKMFSEEKTKALKEMMIKYETDRKDIELKQKKADLQKARSRFVLVISIAALFVIIILLLAYVLNLKHKTENVLEDKNRQLSELNSTKDKFISILAHDLKNPISAFLNITSALDKDFNEIDNEDKRFYIDQLHKSAQQLNSLLKNMLEWALVKHKSSIIDIENLDLKDIAEDVNKTLTSFANENKTGLQNSIPKNITVSANRAYLTAILNNLVTNAIKFSRNNNAVIISAEIINNHAKVIVEDKGIGIIPDDIDKLFRLDIDANTIGQPEGKGTGMGLLLCKELIENMNGEIWAESEFGIGSKFIFTVPLAIEYSKNTA